MSKIEVNQISSQCGSTLTIGQSGDTVTLACGATQTGFGRTGTVDWDTTAKTTSFTAVSGTGYFVNTTSGAITVTLPAGSGGSIVSLKDYANTWNTNNVTLTPNGTDKINGSNANATLSTQDQSVTLVYVDSTKGWRAVQDSTSDVSGIAYVTATGGTITTCGDYKIHTFTGPGTFCVSCSGNPLGSNSVEYIVVAGGGGGGNTVAGGGGGGGMRWNYPQPATAGLPVSVQGYSITVGGGGVNESNPPGSGTRGSNSIFSTITSTGGGLGKPLGTNACTNALAPGGGGGGGGGSNCASFRAGGTGNTPPVSPSQGFDGGGGSPNCGFGGGGGGGGGAGGAAGNPGGTSQPNAFGGPGGQGSGINTTGFFGPTLGPTVGTPGPSPTNRYFAGGGGGAARSGCGGFFPNAPGTGGAGGGGQSAESPPSGAIGVSGTTNTGGGGGGGAFPVRTGGSGGSGIVIIKYKYQN